MSSALERLPDWAKEMLAEARVGRLGLLDESDRPRVLPVTFVVLGEALYSAIDEKPKRRQAQELARLRFLRRRPEAAFLVDHYEDDWRALAWVQVLGRIELVDPARDPAALEALCSKYQPYSGKPPPGPLLRLTPERVLSWRAED